MGERLQRCEASLRDVKGVRERERREVGDLKTQVDVLSRGVLSMEEICRTMDDMYSQIRNLNKGIRRA